MRILLIELAILAAVLLILYCIRGKIRFFRGGYVIRRASYMQDSKLKILIEDTKFYRGKERNSRCARVDGTGVVYSRIPLDKTNKALMVYSYCAPLLAMLKGTGGLSRTLTLGGGGGSVPLYILQSYENTHVDIVEINADSIRTSKEYFLPDYTQGDTPRASLLQADAKDAVKTLQPPYQFIFCDLYVGGIPAEIVYDPAFARDISRLAGDEGLLVVNGDSLSMAGLRGMTIHLLSAFAHAWAIMVSEGFVLMASNKEMPALDAMLRNNPGIITMYPSQMDEETLRAEAAKLR